MDAGREASLHACVFALTLQLLDEEQRSRAVAFVKQHYLDCFPNRFDAPRLSDPVVKQPGLITPFFSHYALEALWEAGEDQFVLDQYRICWGWMLDLGLSTPLEIFDLRWSHCHVFSSCPTWQLSRYVLGLLPDQSGDPLAFRLEPQFGDLTEAAGEIPLNGNLGVITIEWQRIVGQPITYRLQTDAAIRVHLPQTMSYRMLELDGQAVTGQTTEIYVSKQAMFLIDLPS